MPGTEVPESQKAHWDLVRGWFEPFAMERMVDDYEKREQFFSDRDSSGTAGRMNRYDFAAGWAMAKIGSGLWAFFSENGKAHFHP